MSRFLTHTAPASVHDFVADIFNTTTIALVGVLAALTIAATF